MAVSTHNLVKALIIKTTLRQPNQNKIICFQFLRVCKDILFYLPLDHQVF